MARTKPTIARRPLSISAESVQPMPLKPRLFSLGLFELPVELPIGFRVGFRVGFWVMFWVTFLYLWFCHHHHLIHGGSQYAEFASMHC